MWKKPSLQKPDFASLNVMSEKETLDTNGGATLDTTIAAIPRLSGIIAKPIDIYPPLAGKIARPIDINPPLSGLVATPIKITG